MRSGEAVTSWRPSAEKASQRMGTLWWCSRPCGQGRGAGRRAGREDVSGWRGTRGHHAGKQAHPQGASQPASQPQSRPASGARRHPAQTSHTHPERAALGIPEPRVGVLAACGQHSPLRGPAHAVHLAVVVAGRLHQARRKVPHPHAGILRHRHRKAPLAGHHRAGDGPRVAFQQAQQVAALQAVRHGGTVACGTIRAG